MGNQSMYEVKPSYKTGWNVSMPTKDRDRSGRVLYEPICHCQDRANAIKICNALNADLNAEEIYERGYKDGRRHEKEGML